MNNKIIDTLNGLLADAHILNVKLHNYHWNIQGSQFFPIHELTEKYYDYFFGVYDDVAERVLQLGGKPLASTKAYLEATKLDEEEGNAFTPEQVLKAVLADFETMHKTALEIMGLCDEASDISTGNMIGGMVDWLEKAMWMLRQTLN